MQEANQELWELAVEYVTKQQEEAFENLFAEAVDEHLRGDCADCEDGLCSRCEEWIASRIESWQEEQFDDQAQAEYDRLEEQQGEQDEDQETESHEKGCGLTET